MTKSYPGLPAGVAPSPFPRPNWPETDPDEVPATPAGKRIPLFGRFQGTLLTAGNVLIGGVELAFGGSAEAVLIDGVHNASDAAGYGLQSWDSHHGYDDQRQLQRSKRLHWFMAAVSLAVAAHASTELLDTRNQHNDMAIVSSSASLILSGGLLTRAAAKRKHGGLSIADESMYKHLHADTISAGFAVAGAVLERADAMVGPLNLANLTAVVGGTAGAWLLRGTDVNLAVCAHGHGHGGHGH